MGILLPKQVPVLSDLRPTEMPVSSRLMSQTLIELLNRTDDYLAKPVTRDAPASNSRAMV